MSTSFYLECLEHQPSITSDEISQHDDHHVQAAIRMATGADPIPEDPYEVLQGFELDAAVFLRQHPECALDLIDEYGRRRLIPGRGEDKVRASIERAIAYQEAQQGRFEQKAAEAARRAADMKVLLAFEHQDGTRA
jgi:hypothetical protein